MSLNDKTILIVDDTPANIGIISGALSGHFRTKVATNAEKALVLAAAQEKPDLILLDVIMPGMDGYELCRRLKADVSTRDIPVIFLTAKTDVEDEKKGFAVGAVDYIHKPFSAPVVLARVTTHIALRSALQEVQRARDEADKLLHSLLPETAAEEIRRFGTVIPSRHDHVAVLFADIVGFTSFCDKHQPEDVVSRLDALFVLFEQTASAHGLEKIKTVGDAFMAAAGLLKASSDPLAAAVRCGLELGGVCEQLEWKARIGVHFGPVVAGVVGQERYQFDIWGDTVNVAARMAGIGNPGNVVIAADLSQRLPERFHCVSLGLLEVQGKGPIALVEVTQESAIAMTDQKAETGM